ncbi:MAG TPA: hypothetical protein VF286_00095 [Acidiphilium sp.]
MTRTVRALALFAGLGVIAPVAANAATFLTPHEKLVQEINQAYGTRFNVHDQTGAQVAVTQRDPAVQHKS